MRLTQDLLSSAYREVWKCSWRNYGARPSALCARLAECPYLYFGARCITLLVRALLKAVGRLWISMRRPQLPARQWHCLLNAGEHHRECGELRGNFKLQALYRHKGSLRRKRKTVFITTDGGRQLVKRPTTLREGHYTCYQCAYISQVAHETF